MTGLQARFLVDRMAESEKSIHKALTKLMSQLESIEKKVNNNSVDLGTVREKVNLVMTSISLVKEEEAQVARQLKSAPPPYGVPGGARIIGATPASASTASVGMRTPLPLQPAVDKVSCANQVNYNQPHFRDSALEAAQGEVDHSEFRHAWIPKLDFPHFEGSDPCIWLAIRSCPFSLTPVAPTPFLTVPCLLGYHTWPSLSLV
jgi:hypothetical protein